MGDYLSPDTETPLDRDLYAHGLNTGFFESLRSPSRYELALYPEPFGHDIDHRSGTYSLKRHIFLSPLRARPYIPPPSAKDSLHVVAPDRIIRAQGQLYGYGLEARRGRARERHPECTDSSRGGRV